MYESKEHRREYETANRRCEWDGLGYFPPPKDMKTTRSHTMYCAVFTSLSMKHNIYCLYGLAAVMKQGLPMETMTGSRSYWSRIFDVLFRNEIDQAISPSCPCQPPHFASDRLPRRYFKPNRVQNAALSPSDTCIKSWTGLHGHSVLAMIYKSYFNLQLSHLHHPAP